jgi:hypothetical protein
MDKHNATLVHYVVVLLRLVQQQQLIVAKPGIHVTYVMLLYILYSLI